MAMISFSSDYFLHAGNVLLLVAYSVRDILWLRLFAVAAAVITIPFFLLQPTILWAPIGWSCVFATINVIQSYRLFIERRPIQLTLEEQEVRRLVFPQLAPRKVLQVISIGDWITAQVGEQLLENGKPVVAICLIVSGKVRVIGEGRVLGNLTAGNLVGSALLLTGTPARVDALAVEPVRAVRWETKTLERYLSANPETRILMQQHLALDLAGKLIFSAHGGSVWHDPQTFERSAGSPGE
jgi:Cyclic nucleotide-binding domain